jgi:hypothetical protein
MAVRNSCPAICSNSMVRACPYPYRRANFSKIFRLLTKARPAVVFGSDFIPCRVSSRWDSLSSTVGPRPVPRNGTEVPCVPAVKAPEGRVATLNERTGASSDRTGGEGGNIRNAQNFVGAESSFLRWLHARDGAYDWSPAQPSAGRQVPEAVFAAGTAHPGPSPQIRTPSPAAALRAQWLAP